MTKKEEYFRARRELAKVEDALDYYYLKSNTASTSAKIPEILSKLNELCDLCERLYDDIYEEIIGEENI